MCPIHVAPAIRNLELAEEAAGLIQKINSDGYTLAVNQENAGQKPKTIPLTNWKLNGNSFDGKE